MNKRLQDFLNAENISQAQFADTIEVARASVSHVLAGRNKPGYDFIKSISDHYPKLNLDWLINGKGKMYKESSFAYLPKEPESGELFAKEEQYGIIEGDNKENQEKTSQSNTIAKPIENTSNQRVITKILVFYSDNTYQELV